MGVDYEGQTYFRSSLLSLRGSEATTGNTSALRRLGEVGRKGVIITHFNTESSTRNESFRTKKVSPFVSNLEIFYIYYHLDSSLLDGEI